MVYSRSKFDDFDDVIEFLVYNNFISIDDAQTYRPEVLIDHILNESSLYNRREMGYKYFYDMESLNDFIERSNISNYRVIDKDSDDELLSDYKEQFVSKIGLYNKLFFEEKNEKLLGYIDEGKVSYHYVSPDAFLLKAWKNNEFNYSIYSLKESMYLLENDSLYNLYYGFMSKYNNGDVKDYDNLVDSFKLLDYDLQLKLIYELIDDVSYMSSSLISVLIDINISYNLKKDDHLTIHLESLLNNIMNDHSNQSNTFNRVSLLRKVYDKEFKNINLNIGFETIEFNNIFELNGFNKIEFKSKSFNLLNHLDVRTGAEVKSELILENLVLSDLYIENLIKQKEAFKSLVDSNLAVDYRFEYESKISVIDCILKSTY